MLDEKIILTATRSAVCTPAEQRCTVIDMRVRKHIQHSQPGCMYALRLRPIVESNQELQVRNHYKLSVPSDQSPIHKTPFVPPGGDVSITTAPKQAGQRLIHARSHGEMSKCGRFGHIFPPCQSTGNIPERHNRIQNKHIQSSADRDSDFPMRQTRDTLTVTNRHSEHVNKTLHT